MGSDRPTPAVAVAVVSWNTRDLLAACLRSFEPDARAGRVEVWVVDNASTDGSAELVRREFPWVELVASRENLGFGRAVNLVAHRTTTPWIAPANADIEVTAVALEALLDAGTRHPDAGILAPRLVLADGRTQHSVHPFPSLGLALLFALGAHRLSRRLGDRLTIEHSWDDERARTVDWAIAAFLLVRREAFDAAGGFDERQWMYAEDLDLGWQVRRAGWYTRYEPGARVRHSASAAATQAFGEEIVTRWMAASYGWIARRRGPVHLRAVASVNWLGAAVRYAWARPLAKLAPARYQGPRDQYRRWLRAHRDGLRTHLAAGAGARPDPGRERAELAAYLGADYDEDRLRRYAAQLEEELHAIGDEAALYRESQAYLYNLTAFAMTGTKLPYLDELTRALPPGSRVLDYGCGIGSDGLLLLEAGYDVTFADFDNPSTRYLRWRLKRRGLDAPIYDLDREQPPDDFDLAYSFDVIEHVDDPHAFLDRLERHARHVLVNFLDPEPGETELHHDLPVDELLRRSARRELLRYRRLHGRSHLVLYASKPAHGLARVRSLAALAAGRLGYRRASPGSTRT